MNLTFRLALFAIELVTAAGAAVENVHAQSRLFATPQLGAGAGVSESRFGEGLYSSEPAIELWGVGAQLEVVGPGRWSPLLGGYRWRAPGSCTGDAGCEETGWSFEGGVTRSVLPTSAIRPYGGAAVGVQQWGDHHVYLQGRAGIDITPLNSAFALRLEGRYQAASTGDAPGLLLLHTGVRLRVW